MHDDDDEDDYMADDDYDYAYTLHRGALYVEDKDPGYAVYSPSKPPGGGKSQRALQHGLCISATQARVLRTMRRRKANMAANKRLQHIVAGLQHGCKGW